MKLHKDYERYINHSKEGALQLIADTAVGFDGFGTVPTLKELINELRAIALLGLEQEKQKTYLDKLRDLIKELEKEMANSLEEDQFGYAKQDAYDVYKKVIAKLKALVE